MQIVIEIPENTYNLIVRGEENRDFVYKSDLMRAILEGIPLPKGHGKLIDADALNRKDVNCANVPMNFIDTAPTIIEADKSESEE